MDSFAWAEERRPEAHYAESGDGKARAIISSRGTALKCVDSVRERPVRGLLLPRHIAKVLT